ncbi:C-type lectin domain family 4 member M-like [Tachysurus vachellii]|uniref:C-type lectin domain family 4 member M-like n=1 Tax=Tachysurus vachellii TaxID=175792 RepID=UPI00296AC3CA|nr:C-type lectin domain family 4 member M-like [Tachysurus vachellii]
MLQRSSERVEMVTVIYKIAETVRGHDPETEKNNCDTERHLEEQHTGGDTAWSRCCRLTAVWLVLLLFVSLLTAVTVLWIKFSILTKDRDQLQSSYNNLTKDRDQLQSSYNNLTKDRDQLQSSYNNLTKDRDQLQSSYNNLTKDRDQLQSSYNNLTEYRDQLREERDRCLKIFCSSSKQKCFSFSSSFYVISNETKSWEESRKECKATGADLVIINSKEEQEFIVKQLNNLETWIGLSDTVKEGEWKWVDDTPLNTEYWGEGEPNNAGDEDCVVIYGSNSSKRWNDQKCSRKLPWICEKHVSQ